jgi:hypothetical protein
VENPTDARLSLQPAKVNRILTASAAFCDLAIPDHVLPFGKL